MTGQPTVFVVDDDAAVRKGLTLSLRERGFQVESFASADAFSQSVTVEHAGCLILDVRMPHTTGLELQDVLIERGIKLPIIFITAYGDIRMTAQAMRKGALDFLEKPYELDVLLERVREALAKNDEARQAEAEAVTVRRHFERLSKREREVMTLITSGAATTSNRLVARHLGISHRTVDSYRARLMEKMQARSLPELVAMAKTCGIYESDPS